MQTTSNGIPECEHIRSSWLVWTGAWHFNFFWFNIPPIAYICRRFSVCLWFLRFYRDCTRFRWYFEKKNTFKHANTFGVSDLFKRYMQYINKSPDWLVMLGTHVICALRACVLSHFENRKYLSIAAGQRRLISLPANGRNDKKMQITNRYSVKVRCRIYVYEPTRTHRQAVALLILSLLPLLLPLTFCCH